ncbi:MAG TPA: L-rhamnose isomerase [Verrucomicrobiae bacterium]|nr:L-rhamnose isomerase [Verrucomicrobiae bacterium]
MSKKARLVESSFRLARERYAGLGVDVDRALKSLARIPVSLHCWQGDDLGGFENHGGVLGGGLAVTGNYSGKARTADELRMDLEKALSLIPGRHRVNLHAMYGEFGGKRVDRDDIEPAHFRNWIAWAKAHGLGLDFNPTCFAHVRADDGFTLSHLNKAIRRFWIEHCRRSREIGAAMGRALGTPCVTNVWIPDGFKDTPADRRAPRERLAESLDEVFKKPLPAKHNLDSVEPKLFGIGAESCTIGSHEFYLGYAITRRKLLCLDAGHFHPTETIADKISSVLLYLPEILLHVSRGVRWDSDHVVTFTDDLQAIAREIIANGYADRVHLGLDYFDASLNRIAAWVIGGRNLLRALLLALLEPPAIRAAELAGDNTARLALQEEAKTLPGGAVWNFYCESKGVPVGETWLVEVRKFEGHVLVNRR